MIADNYTWHPGWYVSKLHAVRICDNATLDTSTQDQALCGAWVYIHPDGPPSKAGLRWKKGDLRPDKCKRCLRVMNSPID